MAVIEYPPRAKYFYLKKTLQLKDKPGKLQPIFMGPFSLNKKNRSNTVKLESPASI